MGILELRENTEWMLDVCKIRLGCGKSTEKVTKLLQCTIYDTKIPTFCGHGVKITVTSVAK